MEFDFAEVLLQVMEKDASDLHLTAGSPPMIRERGQLNPLDDYPPVTPQVVREVIYSILTNDQRQRLVRTLCTNCKRRTLLSVHALEAAGITAAFDVEAYEPVGCGRCGGSGYKGRVGLYEVMPVSDEIRSLTIERKSAEEIRQIAIQQGMRPLREDGFDKVKHGLTSIAEVARVT